MNVKSLNQIIAYYVPSNAKRVLELPLDKLTHIIFSFTKVVDGQMKFEQEYLAGELELLVQASSAYPDLKVMIACGGWGGSEGFSDMALSKSSRAIFIESVIDFIDKDELDGIDLDWEYPGLPGIGNAHSPEDKENFTSLVTELRISLDDVKPHMLLSFASAGWKRYYDFIELSEVMRHVDYMNIMTFDLAGGNSRTSHHTALYSAADSTKSSLSVNGIINFCIENGVDPQQIIIGAAFYGRSWSGVAPKGNGLYQTFTGTKSSYSFSKIQAMLKEDTNYGRHWDEESKAPFIFNKQDSTFISYDDPESLALKANFVKEHKLGGIMFWQLSHDTQDDELVNSIYNQIRK